MRILSVLLVLFSLSSYGQQGSLVEGRIRFADGPQKTVHIENLSSKEKVFSDSTGFYSIRTSLGDSLVYRVPDYPDQIVVRVKGQGDYIGIVFSKNELQEIVIDKKLFDDNFFGENQKYTPAERKYRSSNTMFFKDGVSGFGLDPLVNLINGTKKKQQRLLSYESQELAKQEFMVLYPADVLESEFFIAPEQITSFVYFVVVHPNYDPYQVELTSEYKLFISELYTEYVKANDL